MSTVHETLEEVSRAAFGLLLKEPFYAHVLAGMPREASGRTDTAAVAWDGRQVRLIVNPDFFCGRLTAAERLAVLKHEVLHVVFHHLFRQRDRIPEIDNLAADLVVNQLVAPWPLPDGAVTLERFPDLALEPDQTVEYYYRRLLELVRETGQSGGHGGGNAGENRAADAEGRAGTTFAPQSARALGELLETGGRGDHGLWEVDEGGQSLAAGRYAAGNLVLRARERLPPHLWGTLPAALLTQLDLLLAERQPKMDWRRLIRIFCASSGRSRIRHTIKRTSKRYGTRPGIKIQRLQRLLVAVDTSGSIDQRMLEEFFAEIRGAWRAGAGVVVVECDAEVQRSYDYRGSPPLEIAGGGGTAFEPVFVWMRRQRPFDGVLYLTDGHGPPPESRPPCKLLWVVPEEGSSEPLPHGPTVRIPTSSE